MILAHPNIFRQGYCKSLFYHHFVLSNIPCHPISHVIQLPLVILSVSEGSRSPATRATPAPPPGTREGCPYISCRSNRSDRPLLERCFSIFRVIHRRLQIHVLPLPLYPPIVYTSSNTSKLCSTARRRRTKRVVDTEIPGHPKTSSSAIPMLTNAGPSGSPGTWKRQATTLCSRHGTSSRAATSSSRWIRRQAGYSHHRRPLS